MALALYHPEKYKVHQGRGRHLGFCTVWNEAELIFNRSKVLQERAAIVGTLYSRQGVNVLLRNLALNPEIRELVVWGNGTLSNTQFGLAGKSILDNLWRHGVEADGTVRGSQFKLETELDLATIETIRQHVTLSDASTLSFAEAEQVVNHSPQEIAPYMASTSFPDHTQETPDIFPSETVGWLVRSKSILEAWTRVVERIMRYGVIKGTQYGYQQRELIGVNWIITGEDPEHPDLRLAADWPEGLRQTVGASADSLKEYYQVFLSPQAPQGLAYTYGNRLMRYPAGESFVDQIEEVIIKQLKSSPDARRTAATTIVPPTDKDSKEPPCLTHIQALQTAGKLHLLATFRSHDIFKAAVPNAFGLRRLQLKIAHELGFELGQLHLTSNSAHIYEQDWEDAFKLARCQVWEREPSLVFNPETQADPRGNLLISVADGKLSATLQAPTGEELIKLEGPSAKTVGKKLAQLELLSRTDHLFDVALELQKAEIAMKQKIDYRQDQPLTL